MGFLLILGILQLLSPLDGISFILGSPLSHLRVCLGQTPLQLSFGFLLLLILFPQQIRVMTSRLNCMSQSILSL